MERIFYILIAALCFSLKADPLFESEEILELRLSFPVKELKDQRDEDPGWLEGRLSLGDESEVAVLDIKVKARGNFRRLEKNCPFPSYWIDFKKKQAKGTVFDGQNRLKVVAHCKDGSASFDQYIYREYLVYKTYSLLTDASFRVRLARVVYEDPSTSKATESRLAFFIEDADELAKRLGWKRVKKRYVEPSKYDIEALCLAEVFQYFIGNTDFSFFASQDECCHNGKAFKERYERQMHFPVPYDFDMTGLVNVPYAVANSSYGLSSVRKRMYRGLDTERTILDKVLQRFREREAEIIQLWDSVDFLSPGYRRQSLTYIDQFFRVIADEKAIERHIVGRMRQRDRLEELITQRIEESSDENDT